ncbi:MAG: SDR family NAD(P)-dependent oxidoreductase [Pyrinomonadaceae bacterium]|nr:SDR family NAD(P)-dependent oxidoreductase [Pyrinomonadaceae bacterium]
MSLSAKSVAVITGAASGIGRELALNLASQGVAGLAISDVNSDGLNETVEMLGDYDVDVLSSTVDVSKRDDIQRFADETVKRFGRATHLINNAGVGMVGRVEQLSIEDMEWMMAINFWGTVYGTTTFLPILKKENLGHIVNLSSVFGFIAPPGQSAYCASKFAVRGFTECLRHELEGTSVLVSVVHPGGIKTNIVKNARRGKSATAEDMKIADEMLDTLAKTTPKRAAETIVKGIKSKNPRILIGMDARQISLIHRMFPKRYFKIMDRIMGGMLSKYR